MSGNDAKRRVRQASVQSTLNNYVSTPETWTVQISAQNIINITFQLIHITSLPGGKRRIFSI